MEAQSKNDANATRNLEKIHALCEQLQEICRGGSKYLFSQNYQKADTAEILLFLIAEAAQELRGLQKPPEHLPALPKIQELMSQRSGMNNVKASVAIWDIVQFEIPNLIKYCENKETREKVATAGAAVRLASAALFVILTLCSSGAHAQVGSSNSGLAVQIQSLRTMMESCSDHASARISALETTVGNNSERIENLEALLELVASRPSGNICTTFGYYWDGNKCTVDDGHHW